MIYYTILQLIGTKIKKKYNYLLSFIPHKLSPGLDDSRKGQVITHKGAYSCLIDRVNKEL